jgi:hypothetical protein
VDVTDSLRAAILSGAPGSAAPPETLLAEPADVEDLLVPMDYPSEHLILGNVWQRALVLRFDPTSRPVRVDTVLRDARFPALSPDGRRLAYDKHSTGETVVSPYPALDRRTLVTPSLAEPAWLSAMEVLFWNFGRWYRVRIKPGSNDIIARPEPWLRDPRFVDTPGWSHRVVPGRGVLYLEGPEQTRATFLRVVPHWVPQMKRAVEEANR